MARLAITLLTVVVALLAFVYQFFIKPILVTFGMGRELSPAGNQNCITVPELQACEELVLHQPTGVVYLACSTPSSRVRWTPAVDRLNATGMSTADYVAVYDPQSSRITHLKLVGFTSPRGLSLHGMDVIPSQSNPDELFVYLINHRRPLSGDAKVVGANSVVEIFSTWVGTSTLKHIKTIEDPLIMTPNDIVGYPDGKSFHYTNDRGAKTGFSRTLEILGIARTSVGYCHVDEGCKIAISNMHGNNGITKARNNDTLYVANCMAGGVTVLERQTDNSLVITDVIPTDRSLDNLSVDDEGALWVAGFPNLFTLLYKHFADPSILSPSSVLRISINTGPAAFYGEKYKVEKVFEDDGKIASGVTSAVYDSKRGRLFLHGLASPHLTVCKV